LIDESVRSDFPVLDQGIYMDSASSSLTPEPVLAAVLSYYRGYRANVGRGIYRLSQIADQRYRSAHRLVARFIGGGEDQVIFTRNATEAINIVAGGIGWKRGDKVVTTVMEHHSNLLPWMRLRDLGVDVELIKPSAEGLFDLSDFEAAIDGRTRLVAVTWLSNVLGSIVPVKEISGICRDRGSMLLVDGAQGVPHLPTRVDDIDCDFLCFSGHKMLGPTGTGVLWSSRELAPLMLGGGMVKDVCLPNFSLESGYRGMEAGTPDIAGGIGLGAAVEYLQRLGMDDVRDHDSVLGQRLAEGLREIDGVSVFGPLESRHRSGLVSFNLGDVSPHQLAFMLDEAYGIMVRSGMHCCIPLMKHLGLTGGTVRASLYIYNTAAEVDELLSAVEEIARAG